MKTVNINGLNFDIHEGNIGISMSGGADSSMVFYILAKYAPGPIHVFSCANGMTSYSEPIGALRVINWVIEKTNRKDIFFHTHWVNDKKIHNMWDKGIYKNSNIEVLYMGLTRPPPIGAITEFDIGNGIAYGDEWDGRVWNQLYFTPEDKETVLELFGYFPEDLDFNAYTPFANTDKQGVADFYKFFDVEELYSVTRSCESMTLKEGHCGTCWWCKERIWGFGKLE